MRTLVPAEAGGGGGGPGRPCAHSLERVGVFLQEGHSCCGAAGDVRVGEPHELAEKGGQLAGGLPVVLQRGRHGGTGRSEPERTPPGHTVPQASQGALGTTQAASSCLPLGIKGPRGSKGALSFMPPRADRETLDWQRLGSCREGSPESQLACEKLGASQGESWFPGVGQGPTPVLVRWAWPGLWKQPGRAGGQMAGEGAGTGSRPTTRGVCRGRGGHLPGANG